MQSTTFRTVAELSRALAAREVSAVELAQDYLARIEAHKELNCFLDVRPEVTIQAFFFHTCLAQFASGP